MAAWVAIDAFFAVLANELTIKTIIHSIICVLDFIVCSGSLAAVKFFNKKKENV
jgi:hypothetical protein